MLFFSFVILVSVYAIRALIYNKESACMTSRAQLPGNAGNTVPTIETDLRADWTNHSTALLREYLPL